MTSQEPQKFFISTDASIRDAIAYLGGGGKGIAFIVDKDQRLVGTVSDGDVRRAMLASENLDVGLQVMLDAKESGPYSKPITASILIDQLLEEGCTVANFPIMEYWLNIG